MRRSSTPRARRPAGSRRGAFTIAQKLAFDGSTPYDLTVPAHTGLRDIPYLTLGFTLSSEKGDEPVKPAWPHLTNLWSVVDFDVTDITKDTETDATIRLPIRNMVNMSYTDYNNTKINGYTYNPWQWCHFQGGIRKTGPGTLCLNGAISYTHTTEVAGGALLVDSSIATSSGVTVDSGAWLGGTGTVSAVTVKDGGGFICESPARAVADGGRRRGGARGEPGRAGGDRFPSAGSAVDGEAGGGGLLELARLVRGRGGSLAVLQFPL